MAAAKKRAKNSLVANINRRKKEGKSRPKSRSTVSSESYARMEAGWPEKRTKRKAAKKPANQRAKQATRAKPRRAAQAH